MGGMTARDTKRLIALMRDSQPVIAAMMPVVARLAAEAGKLAGRSRAGRRWMGGGEKFAKLMEYEAVQAEFDATGGRLSLDEYDAYRAELSRLWAGVRGDGGVGMDEEVLNLRELIDDIAGENGWWHQDDGDAFYEAAILLLAETDWTPEVTVTS